jgi:hypothetical protein
MMAGVLELDAETLAVVKVMLAHLGIGQSICPSLAGFLPHCSSILEIVMRAHDP